MVKYMKNLTEEVFFMGTKILTLLLLSAILLQLLPGFSLSSNAALTYTDADWEQLRQNYKNSFVGGNDVDWSDKEIQNIVAKINASGITTSGISYWCGNYWRDLEGNRSNPNRIFGTEDITLDVSCGKIRSQHIYIRQMAQGYGTKGAVYTYKDENGMIKTIELYQNSALRDAIFYALEKSTAFFSYELYLEKAALGKAGWWDWAHGTPIETLQTLMIMYPYTTAKEQTIADTMTDTCLKLINKIRPNNTGKTDQRTLENRRTRLQVCTMIAALTSNVALMEETRENLRFYMTTNYDTIDGVKPDGSYVLHLYWPMEGTYGTEILVSRIIDTYSCLTGTAFALENSDIMVEWITDTFAPVMHKGVVMPPFDGRYPNNSKSYGMVVLKGALQLVGRFGPVADLKLKQFICGVVSEDTPEETKKSYESYAVSLGSINLVQRLREIVLDSTIPAVETEYGAMRYYTDRAVQHQRDYTVALSMSSTRIAIPETINGCNRYGWYGGDGALYVYSDITDYDTDQYDRNFQIYGNMYRIPGTTEEDATLRKPWNNRKPYFPGMTYSYDNAAKTEIWSPDKNKDGVDAATFVGGTELSGKYITAAMDFEAYSWSEGESAAEHQAYNKYIEENNAKQVLQSDLTAKKSYFMFDDEIVCVGSDIDFTTRGNGINTYVDNRRLYETETINGTKVLGSEDIYVDGTLLEKCKSFATPMLFSDPKYVHQENFGGYYFPNGGNVYVNKTYRQSSNDGNNSNDDYNHFFLTMTVPTGSYSAFELWLSHGSKPVNGSYSYVMLPEKSVAETENYTKNPDIKILKNTTSLHVVQEKKLGITAMVFWKAGTYGDITVDQPMILMVQEKDGRYLLSASDPTQKLAGGKITINRALCACKLDSEISVSGTEKTVLSVDFSKCGGKSVSAEFSTETQSKELMFDFNAKTAAKYRSETYGYMDYSKAANWATAYLDGQKAKVSDAMLVLPLTTRVDGSGQPSANSTIISPSDSVDHYGWSSDVTKANFLNFDPSDAEIFQLRLKLEDAVHVGNYQQGIYLNYLVDGEPVWNDSTLGSNVYNETLKLTIDDAFLAGGAKEGQFVTLTMSLKGKKFTTAEKISGLKIKFGYLHGGKATIDYIYIGPKTESLYFGFDNGGGSDRYQEGAYGGYDYDAQEAPAWATALTDQVGKTFSVDNAEGTLTLYTSCDYYGTEGKDAHYGAYLATSAHPGGFAWVGNTNRHSLSYDPSGAEILEVRFKTENLVAQSGKTPKLIMLTNVETDGITTSNYTSEVPFSLKNGEYQIIRIPVTDSVKAADYIKSLGVRFCYTKAEKEGSVGKIIVDYLYVGKMVDAPSNLYFTFDDTKTDRERYSTTAYGNNNYDFSETWKGRTTGWSNGSWSITDGTLTVTPGADKDFTSIYADSAQSMLHFRPENAEYFQIRFKMSGFHGTRGKATIQFYPTATVNGGYISNTPATYDGVYLNSDQYITVTQKIDQAVREMAEAERLVIHFSGFSNPKNDSAYIGGSVTVDYAFIGRKEDLPIPLYTVIFKDADGRVLATQEVQEGSLSSYTGATPTKAYDSAYHYSFKGWDKPLTNITADTTITATYTATAHSYTYSKVDATNHKAACSCGYSRTATHIHVYTKVNALLHRVACKDCQYSAEVSHSYENGLCICGQEEIKEPVLETTWKMGHTLNLASDISVNLVVPKTLLAGFDMATVYVESTVEVYGGNERTGTQTIRVEPLDNGYFYYFTLDGLTAVQMNDQISSVLYGTKDGQPYHSPVDEYSIAAYAYAQLNKTGIAQSLKTLCADLLRYGSKAQIFKAYRTDNLADSTMTEEQRAYLSDIEAVTFGNTNVTLNDLDNAPIDWTGKALSLESKVALRFMFKPGSYTGSLSELNLRVSYEDIGGNPKTETVGQPEVYSENMGIYVFTVDHLLAAELRSVVSVQVCNGDTPVSCTLQYSADTYGNNKTGTLLDLCKALFAYSDSAKAYFA